MLKIIGAPSARESVGIECSETFTAQENVTIQSESGGDYACIICYSVFLDHGADINCEMDSVNGIRNMKENEIRNAQGVNTTLREMRFYLKGPIYEPESKF